MDNEQDIKLELDTDDSTSLELEIDLASDNPTELVLADDLDSLLGLNELDLELGDDDYVELELAEETDEAPKVTETQVIRDNSDTSRDLQVYAASVDSIYDAVVARTSHINNISVPLTPTDFPYIPEGTLHIVGGMLKDSANNPESLKRTEEEWAIKCLDAIKDISGWTAGINRPHFIETFVEKCKLTRVLAAGQRKAQQIELLRAISKEELDMLQTIYSKNSHLFLRVSELVPQEAVSIANELPVRYLGDLTREYIRKNNLTHVTVGDGVKLIYDFFFENDVLNMLHLTREDTDTMSIGELVRRLFVHELMESFYHPSIHARLVGINVNDPEMVRLVCLNELEAGIQSGSVFAEIMRIICEVEDIKASTSRNKSSFYERLAEYLLVAQYNPSYVNPVPYGHIRKTNTGFILTYTVADQTYEIEAPSVLCEAIGNGSSTYYIPRVVKDDAHECVIYPPARLFTSFRTAAHTTHVRVSGDMFYRYTPRIAWLIDNKMLAEDATEEDHGDVSAPMTTSSTLLQALMAYDNKFEETGADVAPLVITHSEYTIYAVSSSHRKDSYDIALVNKSGLVIGDAGTIVVDHSTGNMIVEYYLSKDGIPTNLIIPLGEVEEEFLNITADQDSTPFELSQLVHTAKTASVVPYQTYRTAVKALCELASLDYEEELQEVQRIIVRDLFYALKIFDIDSLVASRICQAFDAYIQARRNEKIQLVLDAYNLASLQELADIIIGQPNEFHTFNMWNAEFQRIYDTHRERLHYAVDNVCTYLDSLNFDILALRGIAYSAPEEPKNTLLFEALHYIPEIGSRLAVLEDKMVVIRVLYALGDQLPYLFSREKGLVKFFEAPLMKDTIETVETALKTSMKCKTPKVLKLCRAIVDATGRNESILFMHFILTRKVYTLLSEFEKAGGEYLNDYREFMKELGFPYGMSISTITEEEFRIKIQEAQIAALYDKHTRRFQQLLDEGLVNEAITKNSLQLAKAYDMFNEFYEKLISMPEVDVCVDEERYKESFIKYAGSMVITYCPLQDPTASNIIAGMTRAAAFVEAPGDFIYDTDISWLRPYPLVDFHNMVTEYEAPVATKTKSDSSSTVKTDSVVDDDEEYELSYE